MLYAQRIALGPSVLLKPVEGMNECLYACCELRCQLSLPLHFIVGIALYGAENEQQM